MIVEIDGVIYNTDRPKYVAKLEEGQQGDYFWIERSLFFNFAKKWFTRETGGCATGYAVRKGNKMVGGTYTIYQQTEDEARRFLEQAEPELALKYFPEYYK